MQRSGTRAAAATAVTLPTAISSTEQAPASLAAAAPSSTTSAASSTTAPPAAAAQAGPLRKRYEWYQTPTHIVITVLAKEAKDAGARFDVTEHNVSASIPLASGSEFALDIDLFDGVVPREVSTVFRPTKVEIKLTKGESAKYNWPALEASASAPPPAAVKAKVAGAAVPSSGSAAPAPARVAAPASSAVAAASGGSAAPAGAAAPATTSTAKPKRDWAAIERQLAADEAAEKPEGEEALQKLFRQIYGNADEDTRRAMVKSFVRSSPNQRWARSRWRRTSCVLPNCWWYVTRAHTAVLPRLACCAFPTEFCRRSKRAAAPCYPQTGKKCRSMTTRRR